MSTAEINAQVSAKLDAVRAALAAEVKGAGDVWYACEQLGIPLLPLYERGYSSIGCEPCTTLPLDPDDPRSGRWAGHKVECGIHIEAAPQK